MVMMPNDVRKKTNKKKQKGLGSNVTPKKTAAQKKKEAADKALAKKWKKGASKPKTLSQQWENGASKHKKPAKTKKPNKKA